MGDDEQKGGPVKKVRKLKKVSKSPDAAPIVDMIPDQPVPPAPAGEGALAVERIGGGRPPAGQAGPGAREAPAGGGVPAAPAGAGIKEVSARAPASPAAGGLREAERPPAAPAQKPPAEERLKSESKIGSIDIDKLTDELEKDILSTLSSEITQLLQEHATSLESRPEERPPAAAAPTPLQTSAVPPRQGAPEAPRPSPSAQARALEGPARERRVALRLGREFDKLPINMRNELVKTLARADDEKVRADVVIAIASNFDKLPPDVRSLFKTLAADREPQVRQEVATELHRNFEKVTPDYRNELIPLLAKDQDPAVREDLVAAVAAHFERHPPQVQDLLKLLASDRTSRVRDQVTYQVAENVGQVPENLRAELARLAEKAATLYGRDGA